MKQKKPVRTEAAISGPNLVGAASSTLDRREGFREWLLIGLNFALKRIYPAAGTMSSMAKTLTSIR